MLKQNKMAKLHKVKIKYSLIIFVLVVFIFALCQLNPTFMRYYFEVTGRAVGQAKETRGAVYTVVFHANTGTGTMENQTIQLGVPTALNENTFTKDGCSFKEWNTEEDGSGTSYLDEAQITMASEDTIDLYAQWQEGVAMIVETGVRYTTLQAAITAAGTSGQKNIKLLTNVSENVKINKNQNIVFDLQKYTLRNSGTDGQAVPLTNEGTCHISNGTITTSATSAAINNNSTGTLIISGGTVTSTGTKQAIYNDKGRLEISGGYFSSVSSQRATIQNQAGGTLIITGGTIISKTANGNYGAVQNNGIMTIGTQDGSVSKTSPLIQGVTYGIYASTNFTFNDGIIKGKTAAINNETKAQILETDYSITHLDETIDGTVYKTAYLAITETITFNPNGGSVTETTRNVENGNPIGTLPVPTRNGYRFDGWFTLAEGGDEISASTVATSSTTYFAHWTRIYNITFNPNEGTVAESTREVVVGEEVGTLPIPTRNGYRFDGWFTLAEGGDEISASTVPTADVTYFAHWTQIHTITFNPNGGKVADSTRTVIAGEEVGTLPVPTRNGYRFDGWFTLAEGGDEISASTIPTEDTTYFAHWSKIMVAEIDDIKYETIADALATITTNTQTTVKILTDTDENITIDANRDIILDLQNHELSADSNNAVITNNGTLTILNGTISSNVETGTINNNSGATLKIRGGTITGEQRSAVYNVAGIVEISGGYLSSAAIGTPTSDATLERATVQNLKGGRVTITGGTIIGTVQQAISNEATLIIGTQDGSINATSPEIIGKTVGIANIKTFRFYDGIIKGIDDSISGTITQEEANSQEVDGTEVISGQTYKTKCLEPIP